MATEVQFAYTFSRPEVLEILFTLYYHPQLSSVKYRQEMAHKHLSALTAGVDRFEVGF